MVSDVIKSRGASNWWHLEVNRVRGIWCRRILLVSAWWSFCHL